MKWLDLWSAGIDLCVSDTEEVLIDFSGHAGLDLSTRLWRCHFHPEVATPVKFLLVAG